MGDRGPRVTNAKRLDQNSLIGVFDVELPSGLVIRGAMLLESHGRRWINCPGIPWTKEDGSKSYKPVIEFASREVKDRFERLVLPLAEEALVGRSAA
jgi:hypothetical protein